MIIEMRTYTLQPGTLAEVEKRFGEALPAREKHSKLAAFWHTEVGPLNRIIHVWAYDTFEHRSAVRAAAMQGAGWPPPIREFITDMQSELFLPAPFSPALEPRQVGPLFEMRQYTLAAGAIPGLIERWSEKIEARTKFSPLVGGWYSEFGALNKWVHIWAYKDAAERSRVREAAAASGNWPARNPPGVVIRQENALLLPASFSPIS
jgi:NIPSNAP